MYCITVTEAGAGLVGSALPTAANRLYMHTEETFPAICHIRNTPTEPSQLQVIPSQLLVVPQVLVSGGPLNFHWGAMDKPAILADDS